MCELWSKEGDSTQLISPPSMRWCVSKLGIREKKLLKKNVKNVPSSKFGAFARMTGVLFNLTTTII